jgi:uncharacterized protein YkwD
LSQFLLTLFFASCLPTILSIVSSFFSLLLTPFFSTDNNLQNATSTRRNELYENYSHTRPDGSDFYTALNNIPYKDVAENIARGVETAETVVKGWMNSAGHRANILNPNFTEMGVDRVFYSDSSGEQCYWVQLFIAR